MIAVLIEARRQAPERWEWRVSHFDRLAGRDAHGGSIEVRSTVEEGTTFELDLPRRVPA